MNSRPIRPAASRSRRIVALAGLSGAGLLLAACSSSSDQEAGPKCGTYNSGDASKSVTVKGTFNKKPTAEFDVPVEADDLQRTVVKEGDGETTAAGDAVTTRISIFSGKTGKLATSQTAELIAGDASLYPAFGAAIDCVRVGSRVVTVVPPDDLFGSTGNNSLGIAGDETVVFVTDVVKVTPAPTVKEWTEDVPTVKFNDKNIPTVKLPGTKAPSGLRVAILKPGDGAAVAASDQVTLDYQGLSWKDGKVFDQSYGKTPATFATTSVIRGFAAALVGQKVGTQMLVSIPSEYAYAKDSGSPLAGQDLVFLIDIKGTQPATATPAANSN